MLKRTSHRTVRTTAEGRLVFHNDYMKMGITVKPNNSSGVCSVNERQFTPWIHPNFQTHLQMGRQPKYSPQGGKQWQSGEAKQHCSLDFKQLEKG